MSTQELDSEVHARRVAEALADRRRRLLDSAFAVADLLSRQDRPDLEAVCRLMVEGRGYSLVWVGRAVAGGGEVKILASAGPAKAYAETLEVRYDDTPRGRGPTGRCIRTGRSQTSSRLDEDPAFAPWMAAARAHGFAASTAIPLRRGDAVWGALNVYAPERDAFDAGEAALLERIAGHLAFALAADDERTRRLERERQLLVADRLASVGMLASAVAHEINNPLAFAMATLERRLSRLGEQGTSDAELSRVHAALHRVEAIVERVSTFSRGTSDRVEPVDMARVIESAMGIVQNRVRHVARVVTRLDRVPMVRGNRARLGQVALNLLVNAAQAVESSAAADPEIRVSLFTRRGEVVLEVSDDGEGVAPEVGERLFEPFVTTKPAGEGTGLGLAICKEIVEEVGGLLSFESTPGRGATFRVALPVQAEEPARPAEEPRRAGAFPPGARVLLVDDEPLLLDVLASTLAPHFEVSTCASAAAALQRCERSTFDVILCDLMMPGMRGDQLYEELALRSPEQAARFVFMSGGVFDAKLDAFLDRIGNPCIGKPMPTAELVAVLAGVLHERGPMPVERASTSSSRRAPVAGGSACREAPEALPARVRGEGSPPRRG